MGVRGSARRAPASLPVRDEVLGRREATTGVEGQGGVVTKGAAQFAVATSDSKLVRSLVDVH